MNARVTDDVEIRCFAVMAEAAILQKRPEVRLLLSKALQSSDQLLRPALIQGIFPGLPEAACRNLIRWASQLGLCTLDGDITREGRLAAAEGDVPEPEQGRWLIWFMDHPVFGKRIIHIKPDEAAHTGAKLQAIPFAPERGQRWTSAVDRTLLFYIRAYLDRDTQGPVGQLVHSSKCHLAWEIDFLERSNRFRLEGQILGSDGRKPFPLAHEAEAVEGVDYDALARLWTAGHRETSWDPARRRLAVPFRDLSAAEIDTFIGSVAVPTPEFRRHRFPKTEIVDVPLMPKDGAAAERWSKARLLRRIPTDRCLTRSELRAAFFDTVWNTPLEAFGPRLPAHEELAADPSGLSLDSWALHAPVDLAPYEVPAEVLSEFRVGTEAVHAPTATKDGFFLIGLGEPRSLSALANRLVPPGSSAQTVLLCDRHVREAHIDSLKLLREAVLRSSPDCTFLVATRRDTQDARQAERIREVVGTSPRFYEDIYGAKTHPHDRYLLVRPRAGDAWAWIMTGSPLDVRLQKGTETMDDLVRGPELSAYRHGTDVVPDRLRRIFEENR